MNSSDSQNTWKLQNLKSFLEQRRFPKGFQTRVMEYFHEIWTNRSHVDLGAMLDEMPPAMAGATAELLYGRVLSTIPLFRGLSAEVTSGLCLCVRPLWAGKGQQIITEGVSGREMYMLMSGEVEVSVSNKRLGFLSEGAFFGEVPVLAAESGSEIRTRTVTAVTESELCFITKNAVDDLKERYPELKARLNRFARAGMSVTKKRLQQMKMTAGDMTALNDTFKEIQEASRIARDKPDGQMYANGGHLPWGLIKAQMKLLRNA
eukprot:SAG11_NODE_11047_length_787_cov_1.039244_1_plen_261_part_11